MLPVSFHQKICSASSASSLEAYPSIPLYTNPISRLKSEVIREKIRFGLTAHDKKKDGKPKKNWQTRTNVSTKLFSGLYQLGFSVSVGLK